MRKKTTRSRLLYLFLVVVTIIIGLFSRKFPGYFSGLLVEYLGDILWSSMVYFGICLLFPSVSIKKACIATLLFSYFIEVTQLYHASWIDSIRNNPIGALVLGHGFLWSDMVCYAAGTAFAALIDCIFVKMKKGKK